MLLLRCTEMMRREMQTRRDEVDPSCIVVLVRSSCPSSHVFQLTQKTTLFHHGSDFCMTSTVDCSFVLVILVSSSSSSSSSSFRHGVRASSSITPGFWFSFLWSVWNNPQYYRYLPGEPISRVLFSYPGFFFLSLTLVRYRRTLWE
jgi:hypothetical protein